MAIRYVLEDLDLQPLQAAYNTLPNNRLPIADNITEYRRFLALEIHHTTTSNLDP
ncbi:hypothetical protein HK097_007108 [Rhizophlyctis rosea]|uniref:Uncharacterized protein n=1 Tax=Rhizophlyctis rosea TaxID=64517 RepID=A0AAD5X5E8_9FUNG|nr:hypothetical protein HK097_007108 [Rhizophlyctis rosea]